MYISSIRIHNYKSYLNSDEIIFKPGFNVIVGQNDVGKTALLESVSLQFGDNPHRSLKTLPHERSTPNNNSSVDISFHLDDTEARQILARSGANPFWVPINNIGNRENLAKHFESLSVSGKLICECGQGGGVISAYLEQYGNYNPSLSIPFKADPVTQTIQPLDGYNSQTNFNVTYGSYLANSLRSMIYAFKAERFNIGESAVTNNPMLFPNASNLPGVLNYLQSSNPIRFRELNRLVRTIFPHIIQITIPISPVNTSQVRICLWSIDPETERSDLAIQLSESGTGIGQVLSILYILLTSNDPRTIIIDEPQSFLHPGAVRKLISILKMYPQHQYIISTHSPTIVAASNPSNLLLVTKQESESIVSSLDPSDTKNIGLLLSEVGARLSDVFGADNILWVEGRTEEICFPIIVDKLCKLPLLGTQIIGVKHTGDLEGRFAKTAFEIYERLSSGKNLLPPALGFIFDIENRTQQERDDLIRQSNGQVKFLSRKMFENYLLNISAITEILNTCDPSGETKVTSENINAWLSANGLNQRYINEQIDSINNPSWLRKVDAAKILKDIFSYFTECRVEYDKVVHGLALLEWIVDNAPLDIKEVSDLLKELIKF